MKISLMNGTASIEGKSSIINLKRIYILNINRLFNMIMSFGDFLISSMSKELAKLRDFQVIYRPGRLRGIEKMKTNSIGILNQSKKGP